MGSDLAIQLSDVLKILFPDRRLAIEQAALVYYSDPLRVGVQFGRYLVEHGAITDGELERALIEQHAELGRVANAPEEERLRYIGRLHQRATDAIEAAHLVINAQIKELK